MRLVCANSCHVRKTFNVPRYRAALMRNDGRFVASWTAAAMGALTTWAALALVPTSLSWASILPSILLQACLLGIVRRRLLGCSSNSFERLIPCAAITYRRNGRVPSTVGRSASSFAGTARGGQLK